MWGITTEENPAVVRNFADSLGLTFPILVDPDGTVHNQYFVPSAFPTAAYPQDWIVDTNGTVVYANNHFEADEMQYIIEAELAETTR